MLLPESASPATTDQLFRMDNVSSTLTLQLSLNQIFSAKSGLEKSVLNAPKEASSMLTASVLL